MKDENLMSRWIHADKLLTQIRSNVESRDTWEELEKFVLGVRRMTSDQLVKLHEAAEKDSWKKSKQTEAAKRILEMYEGADELAQELKALLSKVKVKQRRMSLNREEILKNMVALCEWVEAEV